MYVACQLYVLCRLEHQMSCSETMSVTIFGKHYCRQNLSLLMMLQCCLKRNMMQTVSLLLLTVRLLLIID